MKLPGPRRARLPMRHLPLFVKEDPFVSHFADKLDLLRLRAGRFFNELQWRNLPSRPMIPAVSKSMTSAELIERVFATAEGLVVGETPDRITSMRFMIENMPEFARRGVNTIYMRGLLSDFAQQDLNAFFNSERMPEDLSNYLTNLGQDPAYSFDERELVWSAKRHNIRIQATSCAANFRKPWFYRRIEEQMITSSLTNEIMVADKTLNQPGKWVAVTGEENINTFRGMPGISELQGGIGLRIEEVNPGESLGITVDPGIEIDRGPLVPNEPMRGNSDPLFADLRIRMEATPTIRRGLEMEKLLNAPGTYLFEKTGDSYTLLHRGGNKLVNRTPVERLANGNYVIDRPSWSQNGVPFPSIEALSRALNNTGMTLKMRIPT